MPRQISLAVALNIQLADLASTLDRAFEDSGVYRATVLLDVARETDIDRE